MTTKLHINISQIVIDIEGDPDLVREIYTDFKDQLLNGAKLATPSFLSAPVATSFGVGDSVKDATAKSKSKRRIVSKKKAIGDDGTSSVIVASHNSPKFDKNLDTTHLNDFYQQFKPKNNCEKILIFLKFMNDKLSIESPNTDQVYTCFKATGNRIPRAFAQAFYDTSSKFGYIDFHSSTNFPITITGENHFNHTLKRTAAK